MQPAGLPGRKRAMGPPTTEHAHPAAAWPFPAAPDYRRAVTRVKDACGAARGGRAEARSLTRASRARTNRQQRGKGTHGVSSPCPANRSAGAKLQAEPRLTPDRSFRDVRSAGEPA